MQIKIGIHAGRTAITIYSTDDPWRLEQEMGLAKDPLDTLLEQEEEELHLYGYSSFNQTK